MTALFILSQVDTMVANGSAKERIQAALARLRVRLQSQERERDAMKGSAKPETLPFKPLKT